MQQRRGNGNGFQSVRGRHKCAMGWIPTIAIGLSALLVLLLAALLHARRGLSGVGLLPWDYAMILCAIVVMAAVTHGVHLWQEGWPLPWEALP